MAAAPKLVSIKQESEDIFIVTVNYDGREYTDRLGFAGLKKNHIKKNKSEKYKDSADCKIRAAMIKAVENHNKKKEAQDASTISK